MLFWYATKSYCFDTPQNHTVVIRQHMIVNPGPNPLERIDLLFIFYLFVWHPLLLYTSCLVAAYLAEGSYSENLQFCSVLSNNSFFCFLFCFLSQNIDWVNYQRKRYSYVFLFFCSKKWNFQNKNVLTFPGLCAYRMMLYTSVYFCILQKTCLGAL